MNMKEEVMALWSWAVKHQIHKHEVPLMRDILAHCSVFDAEGNFHMTFDVSKRMKVKAVPSELTFKSPTQELREVVELIDWDKDAKRFYSDDEGNDWDNFMTRFNFGSLFRNIESCGGIVTKFSVNSPGDCIHEPYRLLHGIVTTTMWATVPLMEGKTGRMIIMDTYVDMDSKENKE